MSSNDSPHHTHGESKDLGPTAEEISTDPRQELLGGALAATIALLGSYVTGRMSGVEALALLEAMLPTTRFLCSALITASGTILALMLTLLSISHGSTYRLRSEHYRRIRHIAWIDLLAFIGSTVFLLLLNIPLGGAEKVPADWFNIIYYVVLVISSALGGLLITVVLILYRTVKDVIEVLDPDVPDPDLVLDRPEEDQGD